MAGRILPDLTQVVVPLPVPMRQQPKRHRGRQRRITVEAVASRFQAGMTKQQICDDLKCSLVTVSMRMKEGGLTRPRKQKLAPAQNLKRFDASDILNRSASMPAVNNPALSESRTIYPQSVVPVEGQLNVLISGMNSRKIGSHVVKGEWKGFPIYTLTLEERKTCPTSCAVWRSCYGNDMHLAKRLRHGPELEERLGHELAILQSRHPKGFAVRLHVLGDFYSVEYVGLWWAWLERFPALHVFGFSARHDDTDPIAAELKGLIQKLWPRFAIRFSNAPVRERSTITIEHPLQRPADAIVCPQQLGKTESCGTCALCWHSTRRIAFIRH